jgi:hypothetical protein
VFPERKAREEGDAHAASDGSFHVAEHFDGPILVVTDGEKAPPAQQMPRAGVGIEV